MPNGFRIRLLSIMLRPLSMPGVVLQAQRDFFGAHTYERVDKEGTFHCLWDDTHKDIGDVTGRIAGEL